MQWDFQLYGGIFACYSVGFFFKKNFPSSVGFSAETVGFSSYYVVFSAPWDFKFTVDTWVFPWYNVATKEKAPASPVGF